MAQGALDLADPLSRLNALPTAVNWRGLWDATTLYYRNDIVVSPITSGSYINIIPSTTILGGADPSINVVAWYAFGLGANGVQEITGSEYITVGPTSTPTITNNGVVNLILAPGKNLNNVTGDPQFPVLEDTGVTTVLGNPGILVSPGSPGPIIDNTGVVNLVTSPAFGFTTGSNINNISLFYTGILSVNNPPNSGITVGTGLSPIVTNTGLLSLNVGTGLSNISTPQTPDIKNLGVVDISGSGITVTGFPTVRLSTTHPSVSLVGTITGPMVPNPSTAINFQTAARIPITQTPGTFWATSIATQTPYSSGTYLIKVCLTMLAVGQPAVGNQLRAPLGFTIYDSVNNVSYAPNDVSINWIQYPKDRLNNYNPPSVSPIITTIVVDLQTLWASGFRNMTHIEIDQPGAPGSRIDTLYQISQTNNLFAIYSSAVIPPRRPP
jgi:hypothetical protein